MTIDHPWKSCDIEVAIEVGVEKKDVWFKWFGSLVTRFLHAQPWELPTQVTVVEPKSTIHAGPVCSLAPPWGACRLPWFKNQLWGNTNEEITHTHISISIYKYIYITSHIYTYTSRHIISIQPYVYTYDSIYIYIGVSIWVIEKDSHSNGFDQWNWETENELPSHGETLTTTKQFSKHFFLWVL